MISLPDEGCTKILPRRLRTRIHCSPSHHSTRSMWPELNWIVTYSPCIRASLISGGLAIRRLTMSSLPQHHIREEGDIALARVRGKLSDCVLLKLTNVGDHQNGAVVLLSNDHRFPVVARGLVLGYLPELSKRAGVGEKEAVQAQATNMFTLNEPLIRKLVAFLPHGADVTGLADVVNAASVAVLRSTKANGGPPTAHS